MTTQLAIVANTSWYIYNFRLNLAKSLIEKGATVYAVAPIDSYSEQLEKNGVVHVPWRLTPTGTNPLIELGSILSLRRTLRFLNIDTVLSYTPKGNVYSGLAIYGTRTRILPNISGLGTAFNKGVVAKHSIIALYRIAFTRAERIFFQNEDDRETFRKAGVAPHVPTERLMGSGVDLARFSLSPLPSIASPGRAITFLFVGRLLWEKGIQEYVDAARAVKRTNNNVRFLVLGNLLPPHPRAVSKQQLQDWCGEGAIEYLGTTDDVPSVLKEVDCMVLPSFYKEGVPRTLIEAAAMGRPIITTDVPGCRDVVNGANGWVCEPRNTVDLTNKIQAFLNLDVESRARMGKSSHELARKVFDEKNVIESYMQALFLPKMSSR